MKTLLTGLLIAISISICAQDKDVPAQINLKDGKSFQVKHFGQLKCGTDVYAVNYIYFRGKYEGTVTEIKDYSGIEKIVLVGYNKEPVASIGNQKSEIIVYRKSGASISMKESEMYMTCYGSGDKYNEISVQIINPITDQVTEKTIATKDIQTIIFK